MRLAVCDHPPASLVLTRRTTGRLVDILAQLLERTNALATHSPVEARAEIVLMEHQAILAASQSVARPERSQSAAPDRALAAIEPCNRLIVRIDITTEPTVFSLVFFEANAPAATLKLGRREVHHFIEIIRRNAAAAAWNLKFGTPWLNAEQTRFSIN